MRVSVHEDNSGALVLAETLPPQFTLVVSITLPRLFGFVRKFINGESSFWRLILVSSLGIFSPRAFLSPRSNTFDPKLLVGNYASLFQSCIWPFVSNTSSRGSVDMRCVRVRIQLIRVAVSVFSCAVRRGVLTVLQCDDCHSDIQSLSLAKMCGEWRSRSMNSYYNMNSYSNMNSYVDMNSYVESKESIERIEGIYRMNKRDLSNESMVWFIRFWEESSMIHPFLRRIC